MAETETIPLLFSNIAEIVTYAEKLMLDQDYDVDDTIKFVEEENGKLEQPLSDVDLNSIIHDLSKEIEKRLKEFSSERCTRQMGKIIPKADDSERVRQAVNFIKNFILCKNGDITELELFIDEKVFNYFNIPSGNNSRLGNICRKGYREILNQKRKEQAKREIHIQNVIEGKIKQGTQNYNYKTDVGSKIFTLFPEEVQEALNLTLPCDPDLWEAEKYHIEAFRLIYLQNGDSFGEIEYNTGNFRAGKSGLFYYRPERVLRTEYQENGSRYKAFDHWKFTEEEISPTPITVVDSARNIDSDFGEILYTVKVKNEYGEVNTFTEGKTSMFTKKGILELICKNFCVTDNSRTLGLVEEYFKALFYKNADIIPKSLAAESTGWKEDGKYFVIGDRAYTDNGIIQIHMLDNFIDNMYSPKGTIENYVSGIKEVIEVFPISRFMLYAGCSSVILKIL